MPPADGCAGQLHDRYADDVRHLAAVILILCSILCWVLAKRITGPIEDISEAARRRGSGDFTAVRRWTAAWSWLTFATTFNNMAARLQTIDNSRGQFMGNIAHELRTP